MEHHLFGHKSDTYPGNVAAGDWRKQEKHHKHMEQLGLLEAYAMVHT
jgi:hypothetical protein